MESITIFTTTFNRSAHLKRLFQSIQQQTNKDFVWLVVDDGSSDDTADMVESFKKEAGFCIDYYYKENGGKHTAMKLGFEKTRTKYMVEIDDDDELLPDTIEIFLKTWKRIEKEQKNNIAEIRALSVNEKGEVCGNYQPRIDDNGYYDSNYIKEDWINNHHLENITSWRMDYVRNLNIFDIENQWLYPKVKLVSESLFWNRIARVYDTRYLYIPLRLYHSDAGDSITLSVFNKQKCYNYVFSLRIIINELSIQGWKNPIHLIKYFAEYLACGKAVGIGAVELIHKIQTPYNKVVCAMICPISFLFGCYLRNNFSK